MGYIGVTKVHTSIQPRHEWKHYITYGDFLALKSRLGQIAEPDAYARKTGGTYRVRSLYFDNYQDKVLREKLYGVRDRDKFRLRYYNTDTSRVKLEKKSKKNGLCEKRSVWLSKEECEGLVRGDCAFLLEKQDPLCTEFYARIQAEQLRPKVLVEYMREPYVYALGNVRITIDSGIKTGLWNTEFLTDALCVVPVPDDVRILEVKYDHFLPEIIKDMIQLPERQVSSYSKYAASRMYG